MKKLNRSQTIGIGIIVIGLTIYFLSENNFISTLSGVLCAIGLGFVFKWIPFTKKNLTE
jgi:multisubunit Na+/H+ antiporter MnhG subunit